MKNNIIKFCKCSQMQTNLLNNILKKKTGYALTSKISELPNAPCPDMTLT